jgi:hypothetical protein
MPKRKLLPSTERIWEQYDYKPLTGELVLRVARGRPRQPSTKRLYRNATIDGVGYQEHRVIWKWVHGVEPGENLDHINQDKHDNRIWNLREVSHGENVANRPWYPRAHTNSKGYYWCSLHRCWVARTQLNGHRAQKNCATEEEAQQFVRVMREVLLQFI